MSLDERLNKLRSGFSRTYWVANTLELFERFAFYGSKAVLAVYLAERVGLGLTGNALMGWYGLAVFGLPILAGPVVDRFGFRKSLTACFSIFCAGYLLVGLAGLPAGQAMVSSVGKLPYAVGALLLTAIGGSLIKPCIVGTVARTTTEETKSLGYSIYYSLVNLGGFLGPILALQVRKAFGIDYVLVMCSITSFLLAIATLAFFKEPPSAPGERRTMGKVLADAALVFGNVRFITFLVIFAGFWAMFWQVFLSLPFYVRDVLKYPDFELIETVDAGCIILLSVPVTALMKKVKPILAMALGFAIASGSWLIMAASQTIPATVTAIAIFAIGEAMQAPRFYEYVADLAPKEQVGTYMGFAFLPVAIGYFAAGFLSRYLVERYMHQLGRPAGMWITLALIGFTTTALMLLYDRFMARK